jgi:hypothetical protein
VSCGVRWGGVVCRGFGMISFVCFYVFVSLFLCNIFFRLL